MLQSRVFLFDNVNLKHPLKKELASPMRITKFYKRV